jgi:hypothetical protein
MPRVRRLVSDRLWDRMMLSQIGVTPGIAERRSRPDKAAGPVPA